jgi:YHS domain-containing protein
MRAMRTMIGVVAAALAIAACRSEPSVDPHAGAMPMAAPAPAQLGEAGPRGHEARAAREEPQRATPTANLPPRWFAARPPDGTRARCAVSNEELTVGSKTLSEQWNGRTYVFCCPDCRPDFLKNPAKYAAAN